jgi:hypothetical protein
MHHIVSRKGLQVYFSTGARKLACVCGESFKFARIVRLAHIAAGIRRIAFKAFGNSAWGFARGVLG